MILNPISHKREAGFFILVNSSFFIAGKTEVVIPVSCVEQRRWTYRSGSFVSGKRMMHASLRRAHQEDVNYSLKIGRGYRSDQGRIWNDIADKLERMEVHSPTAAMADVYESYEDPLSEFLKNFQLIDWQVGAVFAIDGRVIGMEGFGCHDTFKRFFDKLVKSYALDALDGRDKQRSKSVPPDDARRFITSAIKSKGENHPTLGLGKKVTFESLTASGSALVEGIVCFTYPLSERKKTEIRIRSVSIGFPGEGRKGYIKPD